jgi:hypothetical protein
MFKLDYKHCRLVPLLRHREASSCNWLGAYSNLNISYYQQFQDMERWKRFLGLASAQCTRLGLLDMFRLAHQSTAGRRSITS